MAHADKPHCRRLTSTTHSEMTGLSGSHSGQMAKLQVGVQRFSTRAAQANKARWEIEERNGVVLVWIRLEIVKKRKISDLMHRPDDLWATVHFDF